MRHSLISALLIATAISVNSKAIGDVDQEVAPVPKFRGVFDAKHPYETIANRIKSWKETDQQNVWELSGLFEGDIMLDVEDKNGLINTAYRWPLGIVPYDIKESDFGGEDDIKAIKDAIDDYHNKTCIRFRPYNKTTDSYYITIEGDDTGCWSSVGKKNGGQVLNLQNPGCMRHGTIVHELLHALGFYHQQSASDRDDFVTINWSNIQSGKEHNFEKYDKNVITDFDVSYDYSSVMHYSAYAFSKNDKKTITPKKSGVTLGQRVGFSDKDLQKLQKMYETECRKRQVNEISDSSDESSDWLDSLTMD